MKKFILFVAILSLVGCAPKAEKSNVRLSLAAISGSAKFPGGLVFMAKNTTGDSFSKIIGPDDSLDIDVPNGTWDFAVMGWKDPVGTDIFEGELNCDVVRNNELSGEEIDLAFSTSQEKCVADPMFGDKFNPAGATAYNLELNSCLAIKGYLEAEDFTEVPTNVECGVPGETLAGGSVSARVSIVTKEINGSTGESLKSRCIDFDDNGYMSIATSDDGIKLPYGPDMMGLDYVVTTYSAAGCVTKERDYIFDQGFTKLAQGNTAAVTPDAANFTLKVFLGVETCTGAAAIGSTPIPIDSGVYMLCNKDQFMAMGSDPFGTYVLGKDIDFEETAAPGSTYVTTAFSGSLEGNGHALINGRSPLFSQITLPTGGESFIKDLDIESFIINGGSITNNGLGILANKIQDAGAGVSSRLEISDITLLGESSVTQSGAGNIASVGGLIGLIDLSDASSLVQEVELRDSSIQVTVNNSTTSTNPNAATGGVVGLVEGVADFGKTYFSSNYVGVNKEDLEDTSTKNQILGRRNVGGLVGSSTYLYIHNSNFVQSEITAHQRMGGLVGEAGEDTFIDEAKSILTYMPSVDSSRSDLGGIVGEVKDTAKVHIINSISKLTVTPTSSAIDNVGGIVGGLSSGAGAFLRIRNSKAEIQATMQGIHHGGVIGWFYPTDAPGASGSEEFAIDSVLVSGNLNAFDTTVTTTNIKGGIIGYAANVKSRRVIVDDLNISGYMTLAGGYGYADGSKANIEESDLSFSISAGRAGDNGKEVAGIVGYNYLSGTANFVEQFLNIRAKGSITIDAAISDCGVGDCGVLSGENSNSSTQGFKNIIGDIVINDANGSVSTVDFGGTATGGASNLFYTLGSPNCSSLISATAPFVFNGGRSECELEFSNKWRTFGGYTSGETLAGNSFEPFGIDTPAKWNSIREDIFLMDKSFELTDNLDFGGSTFYPIGNSKNAPNDKWFSGSIRSNDFAISNVTYTTSADYKGLIPILSGGQLGKKEEPLTFISVNLTCGSNECGTIGKLSDSRVHLEVKNSHILANGKNFVGGLAGSVAGNDPSSLEYSGFSGSVTGGGNNIGGLIGYFGSYNNLRIENTYIKLDDLQGAAPIGGFIGGVNGDASKSLDMSDSYLRIDPTDTVASSELSDIVGSTLLIGNLPSGPGVEIDNILVDYKNGNLGANISLGSGTGSWGTGSIFYDNGLGSVVSDGDVPVPLVHIVTSATPEFDTENFKIVAGEYVLEWE